MAQATEVTLRRTENAQFPSCCVSCGSPDNLSTFPLKTRSVGWWSLLLFSAGNRLELSLPTCPDCKKTLRRERRRRSLAYWVAACIGVGIALLLFGVPDSWLGQVGVLLAGVLALAPVAIWDHRRPPAVDVTATLNTTTYAFRKPEVAAAFEVLNNPALASQDESVSEEVLRRYENWIGPNWESHYKSAARRLLPALRENSSSDWFVWNWAALLPPWWAYRKLWRGIATWVSLDLVVFAIELLVDPDGQRVGVVPVTLLFVVAIPFFMAATGDYFVMLRGKRYFQGEGHSAPDRAAALHGHPSPTAAWVSVPLFVVYFAMLAAIDVWLSG